MRRFQIDDAVLFLIGRHPGLTYRQLAAKTAAWKTVLDLLATDTPLAVWLVLAGGDRLNGLTKSADEAARRLVNVGPARSEGQTSALYITEDGQLQLQRVGL